MSRGVEEIGDVALARHYFKGARVRVRRPMFNLLNTLWK